MTPAILGRAAEVVEKKAMTLRITAMSTARDKTMIPYLVNSRFTWSPPYANRSTPKSSSICPNRCSGKPMTLK